MFFPGVWATYVSSSRRFNFQQQPLAAHSQLLRSFGRSVSRSAQNEKSGHRISSGKAIRWWWIYVWTQY
jgi:hypothetical protein